MDSNYLEESSGVVQAYLLYLQEMSRKISRSTGMENTLHGKTKKNFSHYKPYDELIKDIKNADSQYLRNVSSYLEKESDRQLFLGSGLVIGLLKKKQTKRYVTAPLIYFLVKPDLDEDGRSFTYSIEWDSVSLNYDLITLILEQDLDEESSEEPGFQSAGVDTNKLETLEDIESTLENILKRNSEELITDSLAIQSFQQIHEKISEFNRIEISPEEFTREKLNHLSRVQPGLTFHNHKFFYIASLPGQLSTYTALRKLILEVS